VGFSGAKMTSNPPSAYATVCANLIAAILLVPGISMSGYGQDSQMSEHDHLHPHHFAEFASVPEKARSRPNPLASDPDSAIAGRKLFSQHCAECHGKTAEGGRKAPNLRAQEVQSATPGMLFWIMTNGVVRRGMPVWSKLPELERWQIVSFLKSLPLSGGEPYDHTHERDNPH
jgi:mono/diheme cytochrome c family protein